MTGTTIRAAKFADIPRILELGQRCLDRSRIDAAIDVALAKSILQAVIADHKEPARAMGSCAFVSEKGSDLVGIIVGSIQPMYAVLNKWVVSDLIWYVDHDADPKDGAALLARLHAWANTSALNPTPYHFVNDYLGDLAKYDKMMRHQGYRLAGLAYEKETDP